MLCGHIHTPAVRDIEGVTYYNTGDWVESCTAIVEHMDGSMELLRFDPESGDDEPEEAVTEEQLPVPLLILQR